MAYRSHEKDRTLFAVLIFIACLVVLCAFLYALNLTIMARFESVDVQAMPWLFDRREAWV